MRNLKSSFEKEGVAVGYDSTVWEPRGRRNRRVRKERHPQRMNSDKRNERIRSTWE